jgi:long-chain fatty acid transport protein
MKRFFALAVWVIGLTAVCTTAYATNGYYTHGVGAKNKSLAGAGTATPEEAIANANNPASAVMLPSRFEVGMSLFSPRRGFDVSKSLANGNGGAFTIDDGVTSGSNYFPIPYVAWNWKRHESNAIGVSIYGRGGMNTDYSGGSATFDPDGPGPAPVMSLPGVFGAGNMGVDFSQMFVDLTYARKVGDLSWGISAVFAIQALELKGVATFAPHSRTFAASGGTQMPVALSDNGHDLSTGGGLKVGGIWQASPTLRFAASYQSELSMSEFDDYSDLFSDGGNFDIPASTKAGLSWDASGRITWHLDVEHT